MLKKVVFVIACFAVSTVSAEVLKEPPASPDPAKKYFFFMHGSGLFKSYADKARDNWMSKVEEIEGLGYTMITEEREAGWDDYDYTVKVAGQVDDLKKKGVPASNIIVGGYSRGARLSIGVADVVSDEGVSYFLLAGCYSGDDYGDTIKGRILSVYDIGDSLFEPCAGLIEIKPGIVFKEHEVDSGYKHSMGAHVRDEWLDPLKEWMKK